MLNPLRAFGGPKWDETRGCIFFFQAMRKLVCDVMYLPPAPAHSGLQADFPECTVTVFMVHKRLTKALTRENVGSLGTCSLLPIQETLVCDPSLTQHQHLVFQKHTSLSAY